MPATIPGSGNTAVVKTGKFLTFTVLTFYQEGLDKK